jgi:general nucleoside transport system permease protein
MLEQILEIILSVDFYVAILRMTSPLLLAAMGGLIAERTGIVTFSMEAMMLMGAIAGVIGSGVTGSVWLGLLAAIIGGMLVALVFALMSVTIGANQIVSSVALNIGILGLSSLLFAMVFTTRGEVVQTTITVPSLTEWRIPLLADIPIIGPIFFNHLPLVYFAFFMVFVVWYILFRTTWGLKIRAVGEHPHAADTLGISVARVRYLALLFTGVMAGLAGAFLSIGT